MSKKKSYTIAQWMAHDREDERLEWNRLERMDPRSPLAASGIDGSCHEGHKCDTPNCRVANQHMVLYKCRVCGVRLMYIPKQGSTGAKRAPTTLEKDSNPAGAKYQEPSVPTATVNQIRLDRENALEKKVMAKAKAAARAAAKEAADKAYEEELSREVYGLPNSARTFKEKMDKVVADTTTRVEPRPLSIATPRNRSEERPMPSSKADWEVLMEQNLLPEINRRRERPPDSANMSLTGSPRTSTDHPGRGSDK